MTVQPIHHRGARAAIASPSTAEATTAVTAEPTSRAICRGGAAAETGTMGSAHDSRHVCQREAQMRDLMIMASHDLKNPLASITAHVEMLQAGPGTLDEDVRHGLAAIARGLHRMRRLTQDLLDYARADHDLHLSPTPLDALVTEAITDHLATSGTARITVTGTLPIVVADATLLRHVLDNLIGNAIKYTPASTTPNVTIHARALPDGATRIDVTDRGIGIPATDQPKIFDPFHRATNSKHYPGTGLGLHICQNIIHRHGGQIGVEDNPGGGTRFWLTLPTGPQPANERA